MTTCEKCQKRPADANGILCKPCLRHQQKGTDPRLFKTAAVAAGFSVKEYPYRDGMVLRLSKDGVEVAQASWHVDDGYAGRGSWRGCANAHIGDRSAMVRSDWSTPSWGKSRAKAMSDARRAYRDQLDWLAAKLFSQNA